MTLALGSRVVFGWKHYGVLGAIVGASLIWMASNPESALVLQLGSIPLVGALFATLIKVLLDINAAERARMVQQLEHAFAFGSSSHMANAAFDKHVEFCEAYAGELRDTHDTLMREGPTTQGLDHAAKLVAIRRQFALWLTPAVVEPLKALEQALRTMGASEHRLRSDHALAGQEHQETVARAFDRFFEVVGEPHLVLEQHHRRDIGIDVIVQALSKVLGAEDLTRLRENILRRSVSPRVEW